MMKELIKTIIDNEEWLMNRILSYAKKFEFTKYTSTLVEPWRLSIQGLSNSLDYAAKFYDEVPNLHPDDKYTDDPISEFGIIEAKKHRERGTTLGMFLGLMKYYKESYLDLIEISFPEDNKKSLYNNFIQRCFDRIEIAYCIEWTNQGEGNLITELQDTNRQMTNEKNKYLTIFESSYSPVVLLNEDLKITNMNQEAIKLFTDLNISGSIYYNDNSSDASFKKLNEQILKFLKSKPNETNFESHLLTNHGNLLFNVKLKKMQDVSNKFNGTVILLDDITERKQAEEKIEENRKALIKLNADKDRFISILAHDLRSPFNTLLGFSELLSENSRECNSDEIEDLATNIHKSAQQSFNLLENLLNWARAEQGSITFIPRKLRLIDVCNDILETLSITAKKKSIFLNCRVEDNLNVFADGEMLKTIIRNLVSNAIKFTNKGGAVSIIADQSKENVTIRVSDNGIGIPGNDLPKLFDISEKISTAGTSGETGTGLGLLLCKEFVEKHGGKIWAESEEGKGSEFIFRLPGK